MTVEDERYRDRADELNESCTPATHPSLNLDWIGTDVRSSPRPRASDPDNTLYHFSLVLFFNSIT